MKKFWPPPKSDSLIASLIFILALTIFWLSPVHQLTDSNFSMLLSESLIHHRSFALDAYDIPRHPPRYDDHAYKNGLMYQLEIVGPHLYYYMPLGSSVLSAPFVAVFNALGIYASNPDGTYNSYGEETIETILAALLMALLASIIYFTARLMLPRLPSALIACGAAFGTQVWSTASRALWSDTWAILLLGIAVYLLLAMETTRRKLHPIFLATLLAWSYFVRPTNAVSIIGITIYLLIFYRRAFIAYAATGALWLALFVLYSWANFHQLLPNYFKASRLSFNSFSTAFAGNLISPSRGLFIFVPILLFIAYLLARYTKHSPHRRLVMLSLVIIIIHLIAIAGFPHWWGGLCYGPRFTTGMIPCFALLAILGLAARRKAHKDSASPSSNYARAESVVGLVLLILSVLMNARGALAQETWGWNQWPTNVDDVPQKIWDWREPQFLAGLLKPPLPREFPLLQGRINFASPEAQKFLWYGWSWDEAQQRWSDGREAAVIFALDETKESALQMRAGPFLAQGILKRQRVDLQLNGVQLGEITLDSNEAKVYSIVLPQSTLKRENILTFKFPDAASPKSLKLGDDMRRLAIRVEWMELEPQTGARQ